MTQLSQFDYNLPESLIAHKPLEKRDESRLLTFDGKNIQDNSFKDIIGFLKKGDVLVLNNSKVIPAKLEGSCDNSKVSINLIKKLRSTEELWQVLAKPSKKLRIGKEFIVSSEFKAQVISKEPTGEVLVRFNKTGKVFLDLLHKYGSMPLPPYIIKKRIAEQADKKTYQTIYADDSKQGSVAAPTAGLHFTDEIIKKIKEIGVEVVYVTLHVGAGTFFPVRVENILKHKIHSEYFEMPKDAAEKINNARNAGGRIIAVGTTSLRVLESAAEENGMVNEGSGETSIFIYPGYRFKVVDMLLTNFHLPKSTLFMLVSAFMGLEEIKMVYSHAIKNKYRFFSYGDCSLLIRDKIVP